MFRDSDEIKERVRQAVDLVDVVGEQIELRRQGRNFVGICPWHADSRPSLQVNPARQSWKCWVCDIGGDVFSFVMQREGIGFGEALRMLADRAGIAIEPTAPTSRSRPGSPDDKPTLYAAMAWACQQFHSCLQDAAEAEPGRAYLQQRGIDAESIERYSLGFVPNQWQWLLQRAERTPHTPEILEAVGLTMRSQRSNRWFDRFRGRVVFPICDTQRRPIAIGGRVLPEYADEKSAKYINSPETRLFSKSDQLYGLHLARDAVVRSQEVIVMEGYTDVVIARQFGIEPVVAVLGTALGERHLRLLQRFASRITLLLDGDAAGQRRASEILELFVANQIDLRIVTLPDNLDPCDYLLTNGREALLNEVATAPDAWEYKLRLEMAGLDVVRDTHRANRALENLLAMLAKMPRPSQGDTSSLVLREQQLLNRLARDFRLQEAELRQRLAEYRRQRLAQPASRIRREEAPAPRPRLEPMERDLFELLLQHPESVAAVLDEIQLAQMLSETGRQLYQLFQDLLANQREPTFETLLLTIDEPAMKSLLVELDESGSKKANADRDLAVRELVQTFHRKHAEEMLQRQQATLESNSLDQSQQLEMLLELLKVRQELS